MQTCLGSFSLCAAFMLKLQVCATPWHLEVSPEGTVSSEQVTHEQAQCIGRLLSVIASCCISCQPCKSGIATTMEMQTYLGAFSRSAAFMLMLQVCPAPRHREVSPEGGITRVQAQCIGRPLNVMVACCMSCKPFESRTPTTNNAEMQT